MPVYASREHADAEAEGHITRTLVAVRYTGSRSAYRNQAVQNEGDWPANTDFQKGIWSVALVPERSLGWWEKHQHFEVSYDPATIAEAFLDANYLPPNVFGVGANQELQSAVFDKLGLEPEREMSAYEDQLRQVDGVDAEAHPDEDDRETEARADELMSEYGRSVLKEAADQLREDADAIKLTAQTTEIAEWLAARDDQDAVDAALEEVDT
ncbi:MAG: hypothetical protein ABEI57_05605 [Halapricum sp.]